MLELLITVCDFMSSVRRYGLDLLLVANVRPMCLSLKSWDLRNADDFWAHKCHMSEERGSVVPSHEEGPVWVPAWRLCVFSQIACVFSTAKTRVYQPVTLTMTVNKLS